MAHYDDVVMPDGIKYRSDGRTTSLDSTLQISLPNGTRKVISRYSENLRSMKFSYTREADDAVIAQVNRIWEAVGTRDSFLARDWALWNTTITNVEDGDESLVSPTDMAMQNVIDGTYVGDGSTTQFYCGIKFTEGSVTRFKRIRKPDIETVRIAVAGSELVGSPSFNVGDNGIVTLDVPPVSSAAVTWGGTFKFPVYFVNDSGFSVSYPLRNLREISGLSLMEERLEDS